MPAFMAAAVVAEAIGVLDAAAVVLEPLLPLLHAARPTEATRAVVTANDRRVSVFIGMGSLLKNECRSAYRHGWFGAAGNPDWIIQQ
jgi:hypothetical protein